MTSRQITSTHTEKEAFERTGVPVSSELTEAQLQAQFLAEQLKSPISRLYEASRARGLSITFEERSRSGLPHKMLFTISVQVGDIEVEAMGLTKKSAKEKSAEKILPKVLELPIVHPRRVRPTRSPSLRNTPSSMSGSDREDSLPASPAPGEESSDTPEAPILGPRPVTPEAKTKATLQLQAGKHPIMLLQEVAMQHKWPVPSYALVSTHSIMCGSNDGHRSSRLHFILKVSALGLEYKGHGNDKKSAKCDAAEGLLHLLGISDGKPRSTLPKECCASSENSTATTQGPNDQPRSHSAGMLGRNRRGNTLPGRIPLPFGLGMLPSQQSFFQAMNWRVPLLSPPVLPPPPQVGMGRAGGGEAFRRPHAHSQSERPG